MGSLLIPEHRACASGHCSACRREAVAGILRGFPACSSLGLIPVYDGTIYHAGFDLEEVEKALGGRRYRVFLSGLKEDFICNHRVYPEGHPDKNLRGTVPHCCRIRDLEEFLTAEPSVPQTIHLLSISDVQPVEGWANRLIAWLRRWRRKLRN